MKPFRYDIYSNCHVYFTADSPLEWQTQGPLLVYSIHIWKYTCHVNYRDAKARQRGVDSDADPQIELQRRFSKALLFVLIHRTSGILF